jgi:hypothetical protein
LGQVIMAVSLDEPVDDRCGAERACLSSRRLG